MYVTHLYVVHLQRCSLCSLQISREYRVYFSSFVRRVFLCTRNLKYLLVFTSLVPFTAQAYAIVCKEEEITTLRFFVEGEWSKEWLNGARIYFTNSNVERTNIRSEENYYRHVFSTRTLLHRCSFCSVSGVWNVQGYVADYGPVDGLQLPPEFDKFKVTAAAQSMLNCHKRHMCGFCKKVFPLKNLLRRHVQFGCKMNPRNSQFACSFCQYKSTYKANMERHVRNVHDTGVLKFRCDLCNFRSNYSFCVRRHMKTFHRTAEPNETKQ